MPMIMHHVAATRVPLTVAKIPMTVMPKFAETQQQAARSAAAARSTTGQPAESGMLSRIAESMFWIGRYVERAEDTARLLQTHLRMIIEDTTAHEVDACRNLLALMSVDHVEDPT